MLRRRRAMVAAMGGGAAAASPLLTDLVAYWNMGEASGVRADSVGSNDLSDNNTVTQAVGKQGNAAQFTKANSEYLLIADTADLSTGDIDFSIACWVYLDSNATGMNIINKARSTAPAKAEYALQFSAADTKFKFIIYDAAVSVVGSVLAALPNPPLTATWYCIVAWHDATANKVYIQVNNGTVYEAATTGVPTDTNARVAVGIDAWALTAIPFDGRIDELGFWKRTLTVDERTELYNGGAGITYPF